MTETACSSLARPLLVSKRSYFCVKKLKTTFKEFEEKSCEIMVRKKIVELHDCNVGHSCSWNSWEATQNRNRVSHVSLYKLKSHAKY